MPVRVYHAPGSRSARVIWLLEEVGARYEEILMPATRAERDTPEYRRLHPLGRVPAMEDDDGILFESAALLLQIGDRHPESNAMPPIGTRERGLVYQWTMFGMTEIERSVADLYFKRDGAREQVAAVAASLDTALTGRDFLVGDALTVADVVCGGVLSNAKRIGLIDVDVLGAAPNLAAYLERLEARPARQKAYGAAAAQS
jgi:glutathione S-transferase